MLPLSDLERPMLRTLALAALAAALAGPVAGQAPPGRDWPSARHRGTGPSPPPCTCRGPSTAVEVGGEACLAGRLARCVMVLNNTSWAVSEQACGTVASATHRRTPLPVGERSRRAKGATG